MSVVLQLMMGISLAACAGLRAWLPMLVVGLLAHGGYVHLNSSFEFLARNDALIIFGVATAIELVGDKIIAVDHFLDAVSTVVRPAVGTVLASSMLTKLDPLAAVVLGLIVGGGASFTVHAGKAVVRAKASALVPFHGGVANAAISVVEDLISGVGLWISVQLPVLAFVLALVVIVTAIWLVIKFIKTGKRLFASLTRWSASPRAR